MVRHWDPDSSINIMAIETKQRTKDFEAAFGGGAGAGGFGSDQSVEQPAEQPETPAPEPAVGE